MRKGVKDKEESRAEVSSSKVRAEKILTLSYYIGSGHITSEKVFKELQKEKGMRLLSKNGTGMFGLSFAETLSFLDSMLVKFKDVPLGSKIKVTMEVLEDRKEKS